MVRVFTTVLLAVAVLAGIWYLPILPFRILILCAIGLGLWEYAKLVFQEGPTRLFCVALGISFASLMITHPRQEILCFALVMVVFLAFLWELVHHDPLQEATHRVGLLVLGICYLALPLSCWSWLRDLSKEWVMVLLFPTCLTDTFGFLVGKTLGRKKMSPVISSQKTWEGFFGSLFGGVFGLWLALKLFHVPLGFSKWELVTIGVAISLIVVLGDLFESLIKRSVGVKDSSHLIPGHGGALDRLDALTFTAPFFYFLLNYL